ncbi:hypothetical protein INT43_005908 [Umbelopsis isabellina]|uniref:FAS1 domain-containing protein n=1 Tax=Mortierella isabellina TaxID=91625 RepID=A0A8H7U7U6_MORIS|nr:hypothetical protein INT43_005908 [Umbelopsis isabellina]
MMFYRHHSLLSIALVLLAVLLLVRAQENDARLTEDPFNSGAVEAEPEEPIPDPAIGATPPPPPDPYVNTTPNPGGSDILAIMEANGAGLMAKIIRTTPELGDIRNKLSGDGNYTYLAPSDQAIQANEHIFKNATNVHLWAQYYFLLEKVVTSDIPSTGSKVFNTSVASRTTDLTGKTGNVKGYVVVMAKRGNDNVIWSSSPKSPAKLIKPDLQASNGVVHIMDQVISPPPTFDKLMSEMPEISSFLAVLKHLNMTTQFLHGETIFAPHNDAMKELPTSLWSNSRQALAMQHHIMVGQHYTANLKTESLVNTKTGAFLKITKVSDDEFMVNHAHIVQKDIGSSNGVLHVVDHVLFRPGDSPADDQRKDDPVTLSNVEGSSSGATTPRDLAFHGDHRAMFVVCLAFLLGYILLV